MYDIEMYDSDDPEQGFGRGYLFIRVCRLSSSIFTLIFCPLGCQTPFARSLCGFSGPRFNQAQVASFSCQDLPYQGTDASASCLCCMLGTTPFFVLFFVINLLPRFALFSRANRYGALPMVCSASASFTTRWSRFWMIRKTQRVGLEKKVVRMELETWTRRSTCAMLAIAVYL